MRKKQYDARSAIYEFAQTRDTVLMHLYYGYEVEHDRKELKTRVHGTLLEKMMLSLDFCLRMTSLLHEIQSKQLVFTEIKDDTATGRNGDDNFIIKIDFNNKIISMKYYHTSSCGDYDMNLASYLHIKVEDDKCHYMGIDYTSKIGIKAYVLIAVIYIQIFGLDKASALFRLTDVVFDYFPDLAFGF